MIASRARRALHVGPFIAGLAGVVIFEEMMRDPRSVPDDSEGLEALLAARGVEQLPNPAIAMPGWLEDTRS